MNKEKVSLFLTKIVHSNEQDKNKVLAILLELQKNCSDKSLRKNIWAVIYRFFFKNLHRDKDSLKNIKEKFI